MKRMSFIRWAAAVAGLYLLLPGTAAAQVADSAAFIVRLGHDTVSVERWVRTADRLDAVIVGRTPRTTTRRYALRFGPDGRVTHATLGDGPEQQVADGAIPIAGGFYAPYVVALERAAREGTDETSVAMMAMNAMRQFTIRRIADSEYAMPSQFDQPMRARFDDAGRLIHIEVDGGTTIERVAWFDIDALAREFAARDERGTGLGPLSPRDTVRAGIGGGTVLIDYSRPSARGRTIFGGLVPWGEVWRTGANETTTLITDRPLQFDGVRLEPGSYSLFTIPAEDGWQLVFNREVGMNALARDPAQDIGRIAMTAYRTQQPVEQLTIAIEPDGDGGVLRVEWGEHGARVRFAAVGAQ